MAARKLASKIRRTINLRVGESSAKSEDMAVLGGGDNPDFGACGRVVSHASGDPFPRLTIKE